MSASFTREAAAGIYGAWRLALRDPSGMDHFVATPEGALRSFRAAVLLAPPFLLLLLFEIGSLETEVSAPFFLLVQAIVYVINWTAFPLAMSRISVLLGRGDRYPAYLCAYNWSAVVQAAAYLPVALGTRAGLVPEAAGQGLLQIIMLGLLVYQWYVARTALKTGGLQAAGLVLLDLMIGMMILDVGNGVTFGRR